METSRRRVLIVDDNYDAAETLSLMLEALGQETAVAHSGVAGLQLAQIFKPDTAILDIGMPGMNGFDLAIALRKLDGLGAIQLIALTGWDDDRTRARAKESGFDFHLVKPASIDTIIRFMGLQMETEQSMR